MFIRKKTKKDPKTLKKYFTYQLVKSVRTEKGPRQEILLSIGNSLDLTDIELKLLANCIENVISGIRTFLPPPEHIERLAHVFAKQLIKKQALEIKKSTKPQDKQESLEDFETVDLNTLEHQNCRTVGIEQIALETFRKLGLDKKLAKLGLNQSEIEVACGVIIGRLVKPGSDLATYYWLQNLTALDELLETDFSRISRKRVYKIADKLLTKKKALEEYLEEKEEDLFSFNSTIALYDITNTYFEGSASGVIKAKRGRSKDKRKDRPLVALGLILNEEGFPKRSRIFEGNVSEPKTFKKIVKTLHSPKNKSSTIVIDAGIATEDNIKWLRENGYSYIVCSRASKKPPDDIEYTIVKQEGINTVKVSCVKDESTGESFLFCHSTAREQKDLSIKLLFKSRFEEELKALSNGLVKKGCLKKYEKVLEKIGRLKARYSKVAQHYNINVHKGANGNVLDIYWEIKEEFVDNDFSGNYCLRSFGLDWQADKLWKIYMMLIRVEDGFRSLKSELGLRPIYHQIDRRVDGHLFISLLAYHIMQTILYQLKKQKINLRWNTLKAIMSSQTRVTTAVKNSNGKMIYVRSSTNPEPYQKKIYQALGISDRPGRRTKTIV